MRKIVYLGFAFCALLSMASCKSSESAYKKAFEKAKQQELAESQMKDTDATAIEEPKNEVTPVITSTEKDTFSPADRHENVEVVGNGTLKKYSVVCGSFGLKANAESLRDKMIRDGYNAMVVFNSEIAMYRVITATFDTRDEAVSSREQLKRRYPDNQDFKGAWLLVKAQ